MTAFTPLEIALGSIVMFFGAIGLFLFLVIWSANSANQRLVRCFDAVLTWMFPVKPYTPNSWPPRAKLLDPPVLEKPNTSWFSVKPKVVDYSTDPDAKLSCVYVSPDAILDDKHISAHSLFTESADESSSIKLLRSGTGFRVYNHPTIKDGQWLSCRR